MKAGTWLVVLASPIIISHGRVLRDIAVPIPVPSHHDQKGDWTLPLVSSELVWYKKMVGEDQPGAFPLSVEKQAEHFLATKGSAEVEECHGKCLTFHVPYTAKSLQSICSKADMEAAACANLDPAPHVDASSPIQYCGPQDNTYKTHYHYFVHAMLLSPALRKHTGIQMVETKDPFNADIVVCDEDGLKQFKSDPRHTGKKQFLIGVDHQDSSSASTTMFELKDTSLLTYAKSYSFHDQTILCECGTPAECHAKETKAGFAMHRVPNHLVFLRYLMRHSSAVASKKSVASDVLGSAGCGPSPASTTQKISAIIPFWLTVRRGPLFSPFAQMPNLNVREIDVAFIGGMHQNDPADKEGEVFYHRSGLVTELQRIGEKRGWNVLIYQGRLVHTRFHQVLRDTKLFVSPFGLGEWSGKDEESVMSGAVLVKPGASWFTSTIPIYSPGKTCLEVRPDWSDLEEVLADALAHPEKLTAISQAAYKQASRFIGYGKAVQDPELVEAWGKVVEPASSNIK